MEPWRLYSQATRLELSRHMLLQRRRHAMTASAGVMPLKTTIACLQSAASTHMRTGSGQGRTGTPGARSPHGSLRFWHWWVSWGHCDTGMMQSLKCWKRLSLQRQHSAQQHASSSGAHHKQPSRMASGKPALKVLARVGGATTLSRSSGKNTVWVQKPGVDCIQKPHFADGHYEPVSPIESLKRFVHNVRRQFSWSSP